MSTYLVDSTAIRIGYARCSTARQERFAIRWLGMPESGQSSTLRDGDRDLRKVLRHGYRVDPHHHRLGQLLYPASGVLVTTAEHGTWVTPANRVAWTPPGFAHYHRFFGETDIRMLDVALPLCAALPREPSIFAVNCFMSIRATAQAWISWAAESAAASAP